MEQTTLEEQRERVRQFWNKAAKDAANKEILKVLRQFCLQTGMRRIIIRRNKDIQTK